MQPITKRRFLIALLSLTGATTLFTILIVIVGGPGRNMETGIFSAFAIGFLLLLAFAAFTAMDHPILRFPAYAGTALACFLMIALPLFMLWTSEYRSSMSDQERQIRDFLGKLAGSTTTFAALLCLLPYVLAPKMKILGRFIQLGTAVSQLVVFFIFQAMVWDVEILRHSDSERVVIPLIILAAAGTLATAILNKFFGIKVLNPITFVATTIHLTCPRCLKEQDLTVGIGSDTACQFCKLKIKIELEEPLCPTCGYNLHNLTTARCPECGTQFAPDLPPISPPPNPLQQTTP